MIDQLVTGPAPIINDKATSLQDFDWPAVSVVIVSYNGRQHLDECLSSLREQCYPRFEVLLVDNGSSDGSLDLVRRDYPEVMILESGENLGYSGAVNFALAYASGEYIAVLNMDVLVETDWLVPLVRFMEEHPEAGAVTPKIILYGQRDRINALGQNVHITGLGFNRRLHYPVQSAGTGPTKVSGVHGSAFLVRKDFLTAIGGMNANNFMYHEDVDISWMVILSGYDIFYVPESVIYHKYRLFMTPWKYYYLERNRWALLLTTWRWPTLFLLSPLFLFTELMMAVYCVRRGRSFIAAKLRAVKWTLQNWDAIGERRAHVQSLRRRSDRDFVAALRLNYDWDQLLHLAADR